MPDATCPLCGETNVVIQFRAWGTEWPVCFTCRLPCEFWQRIAILVRKAAGYDAIRAENDAEAEAIVRELSEAGVAPLLEAAIDDAEDWREERARLYALRDAAVEWIAADAVGDDERYVAAEDTLARLARQEADREQTD